METARAAGLSFLKLFPAEVVGGRGMLAAVGQAMPDFSFVPTGGVTLDSLGAYLGLANVVAVGGSWIASGKDSPPATGPESAPMPPQRSQKPENSADRRDAFFASPMKDAGG